MQQYKYGIERYSDSGKSVRHREATQHIYALIFSSPLIVQRRFYERAHLIVLDQKIVHRYISRLQSPVGGQYA